MKISEHFLLEEFVPKEIFKKYGENSKWFVDPKIIQIAEFVRTYFGTAVTINNWHKGGQFNYRGFRDPECTVGAKLSQHRFGRAIDINVAGTPPKAVYDAILAHSEDFIAKGLTTMEDIADTGGVNGNGGWVHVDIRHTNSPNILIVKP